MLIVRSLMSPLINFLKNIFLTIVVSCCFFCEFPLLFPSYFYFIIFSAKETFLSFFLLLLLLYLQVAGKFCMELAIKKAKEVGVAWVTCTG